MAFNAKTANGVWLKIASALAEKAGATQQSRLGTTAEILHAMIAIDDPIQRWVVGRVPPLNPAFALAEVVWIMTGRRDARFLTFFFREFKKFVGNARNPPGAYGHRLRKHLGVDQLTRAYQALRAKPHSRQAVLQIWDAKIDLPKRSGREASGDIPCNVLSMLKIRSGALEWMQIMRSNDAFRGLPYNLVQFTTLQEIVAGWLGVKVGGYHHVSDSLHVYEADIHHLADTQNIPCMPNTDSLALPKSESEAAFKQLEAAVENIISPACFSVGACERQVAASRLPPAFLNILRVMTAEGIRRRGKPVRALAVMADCSNRVYSQLFERWTRRIEV